MIKNDANQLWETSLKDPILMNKLVTRLSYFLTSTSNISNSDIRCELYKHLVLQVLVENENKQLLTVENIQDEIKRLFNEITLETVEIQDALADLKLNKKVFENTIEKDSDGNTLRKYSINQSVILQVKEIIRSKKNIKEEVLGNWLIQVEVSIGRTLLMEEKEMLKEDLDIFFGYLFLERGLQTKSSAFVVESNEIISELDNKPEWKKREAKFRELRYSAIRLFLQNPDEKRATYLLELNDSAFFISLLHIDPQLTLLFNNNFSGKILFLDSNIIYRLLGLQTEMLKGMTKQVIEASRRLGCKLCVSKVSIDELDFSLTRAVEYLQCNPPLSPEYEDIKIQYSGEARGFIIAYWKEYAKTEIPLDHFANKYRHISKILTEEYNIEVTSDYLDIIYKDPNLQEEINYFNNFLIRGNVNPNRPYMQNPEYYITRHPALIRHDVILMMIIKKIRGIERYSFNTIPAWLITADGHVIDYSHKESSSSKNKLPIAIHAREWLLFLRPWLPRTDDYNKAMVALISSEHIRSFNSFSPILIDQAIRILQSYKDMTPKLAAEMLADHGIEQQLISIEKKIERSLSEDYDVDVNATSDIKISESYLKELTASLFEEHRNKVIESSVLKLVNEKERERANTAMDNYQKNKELTKQKEIISAQEKEKQKLLGQSAKKDEQIDTLQSRQKTLIGKFMDDTNSLKRNIVILRLLVTGLIIILGVLSYISIIFPYLMIHSARNIVILLTIVYFILLLTLGLSAAIGFTKTWKIFTIVNVVVGIISSVYFLIAIYK
jgi:hypothetical protein